MKRAFAENILVCPKCSMGLIHEPNRYFCGTCNAYWPVVNGVIRSPTFDASVYWGEISRQEMLHINKRSEVIGAERAFLEWTTIHPEKRFLGDYVCDWRRAVCFDLTGLSNNSRILDYGCGYGTIGLAASQRSQFVYLADSTAERVEFAARRASETGAENVIPLAVQCWEELPIPKASLDVIVINGVLEWVALTRKGTPKDIQLDFLRAMESLLRPSGKLFVAIENRFAYRYLRGYPDDHTNLRFTSILPRLVSDAYCNLRGKNGYRTLTWSLREHRKELKALGFQDISIYCLYPDYRYPQAVAQIDQPFALAKLHEQSNNRDLKLHQRVNSAVEQFIGRLGLWPYFVYSYGVVATKRSMGKQR